MGLAVAMIYRVANALAVSKSALRPSIPWQTCLENDFETCEHMCPATEDIQRFKSANRMPLLDNIAQKSQPLALSDQLFFG